MLLTVEILCTAYAQGYFPMPHHETGEIEWYRPDPRAIFPLEGFHVSRSLQKTLDRGTFEISFDRDFTAVMRECATRHPDEGNWITEEFIRAYSELHRHRLAHSVEVWSGDELVGGTYGVALGGAFFAESMFHRKTDASKVALYHLVDRLKTTGYTLLEVQFLSPHLESLGAIAIPDEEYMKKLAEALQKDPEPFATLVGAQ